MRNDTEHLLSSPRNARRLLGAIKGLNARKGIVIVLLALSGCATTRTITVPCVAKDQAIPAEPPKVHDKLTGKADEDLRTVAGSALRLRAWGQGLSEIIEGCRS